MRIRLTRWTAALGTFAACVLLAAAVSRAEPLGVDAVGAPAAGEKIPEIEDAVARFQVRDFAGAFTYLQDAVKRRPDLPPAQVIMAQLFLQAQIGAGVRTWLDKAAFELPKDPQAYIVLGQFALQEGRMTEADLLYIKAAALMAGFEGNKKRKETLQPQVLNGQAAVAEAHEDWPGAQKLLEAWLKLDPKQASVMQRVARAMFQQKNAAGALEMLKKAKDTDPEVLTPEAMLAQFYESYGDHANAEKWMTKALAAPGAKEDLRTKLVAAQWALQTDQAEKAEKWAAEALQIDANSMEAKVLRGVVALFQKDYKQAELYFESAHLQSPGNFAASNNLALALVEQGDPKKQRRALEYAEANARQYTRDQRTPEAASTLGWVYYKLNRLDDAEKALSAAVSGGQVSPDTAYYLAMVSADKNRPEEGRRFLKAALDSKRPFTKKDDARLLLEKLNRLTKGGDKPEKPDSSEKPSEKPAGKTTDKASK